MATHLSRHFREDRGSRTRGLEELLLIARLRTELTEVELLELYMNVVYLGGRAEPRYGVEAGSRYWFGKPARELDPGEAARLASMGPRAHDCSPARSQEPAVCRPRVLRRMVDRGWLLPDEAAFYEAAPLRCEGP